MEYEIQTIAQVGGATRAVVAHRGYVYAAIGRRLVTLDISNPAQPKTVGDPVLVGEPVKALRAEERRLYALTNQNLLVYEIDMRASPRLLGRRSFIARTLDIVGQRAYLVSEEGLFIFDVSDPTHISLLGSCQVGSAFDVAISGDHAFVGGGLTTNWTASELWVIDISDPTAPRFVNRMTFSLLSDIEIEGNYAYLATNGLKILDISDPLALQVMGEVDVGAPIVSIAVHQGRLFANARPDQSDVAAQLFAIDVSQASSPAVVGTLPLPKSAWWETPALALVSNEDGTWVLQPLMELGLQVVDASVPTEMQIVGSYSEFIDAGDVFVSRDYAYVLDWAAKRLLIYEMTDPARPTEVAEYGIEGEHIVVQGDYAYVGGDDFRILDVRDPAAAVQVGFLGGSTGDFDIKGPYAYLGGESFRVVDISNPAEPRVMGDLAGAVRVARVRDGLVYTLERIIDVSNPANPVDLVTYALPYPSSYFDDLDVEDGYLYVAGVWGYAPASEPLGSILDVSDPRNPILLKSDRRLGGARVDVVEGMAYISGDNGNLNMVDVTSPTSPREVGAAHLPNPCWPHQHCYWNSIPENIALFIDDDLIYAAQGVGGLFVLRPTRAAVPPPTPTPTPTPVPTPIKAGLTPVAQFGGVILDMDARNNLLYVGEGRRLLILDAANSEVLEPLGRSAMFAAAIEGVAVERDFAYVVAEGLHVVDVSNPAEPVLRGHLPGVRGRVQLSGNHLYAVESETMPDLSRIQVVDASNPDAPSLLGAFTVPGREVVVLEPYVYTLDEDVLRIFQLSESLTPSEVGYYELQDPWSLGGRFVDMAVQDGVAYLTVDLYGYWPSIYRIVTVDVSVPAQPTLLSKLEWPQYHDRVGEIEVKGDYVYMAYWRNEIGFVKVYDVSDPSVIRISDSIRVADGCQDLLMFFDGNRLVAACTRLFFIVNRAFIEEIDFLDISDPAHPVPLSDHKRLGRYYTLVEKNRDALYLARELGSWDTNWMEAVVIADPANPRFETGVGYVTTMTIRDARLYSYADIWSPLDPNQWYGDYLTIYDASDPRSPRELAQVDMADFPYSFYRPILSAGAKTLFVNSVDAVVAFDVQDPDHVTASAAYEIEEGAIKDMVAVDDRLYVLTSGRGDAQIIIFDVSDPTRFRELGRYAVKNRDAKRLAMEGGLGYFISEAPCCANAVQRELHIVDLGDPRQPISVAKIDLPITTLRDLHVDGDFIYILDERRLWVVDASERSQPRIVGAYSIDDGARAVETRGPFAFVVDGVGGLLVLRNELIPPPPASSLYLPLLSNRD
ncbi:MAG: hypothetical protein GXP42_07245 [Chloroflexi bacterium]|nr:hypothetical protein [Chloroflexota bacterium]